MKGNNMIFIYEKPAEKVVGVTSLFIVADYNPAIVNILSSLDCRNYNKETKMWEIPIPYLSTVLDNLVLIDDVTLTWLEESLNTGVSHVYNLGQCKTKLFQHQIEGVQYGLDKKRWLLLDLPGCGKSLTVIMLAKEVKERENIKHCLVICGLNSLKYNWLKEINRHTDLSACLLGQKINKKGKIVVGSVQERLAHLKSNIEEFFVITNIETLRDEDIIEEFVKQQENYPFIIVDEAHKCKDPTSLQGSNLLKLSKSPYRVALTGTLLLNNPLDAYVPLKWIGVEKSNYTRFKSFYCKFVGPYNNIPIGYKNLNYLSSEIQSCSLRRSNYQDLPPLTIIPEYVDMDESLTSFYNAIVNGVKETVDKVKLNTANTLALTIRLRQATALPSILTSENIQSAKFKRACELVEEITQNNEKVVIFSTFKPTIDALACALKEYNPVVSTGDMSDNIVEKADYFQNNPNSKVFMATWQKAGTGITITKASYMIFIDTPWTWGSFEQAYKRIHRTGTEKPVFIYELITRDTFDEDVHEILYDKQALSDYVLDQDMSTTVMERIKQKLCTLH